MSLLNDALRAAEQRQSRPEVAAAYAGHSQPAGRRRYGLWVLVLLAAVLIGVSVFWFMTRNSGEAMPAQVSARPASETVSEPNTGGDAGSGNVPVDSQPADARQVAEEPGASPVGNEPVREPPPAPEPDAAAPPEPKAQEVAQKVTQEVAQEVAPKVAKVREPEPRPEPVRVEASEPETAASKPVVAENKPAQETEEPTPPVKQVRETPEAIDRRVSRELSSLLRSGENREAEQRLQELAATQAATASREVFARQMLVQGMPDRALAWLPLSVTDSDAGLRLLRARALHAKGGLTEALATLENNVPAVNQNVEYRVTLATLLQQAGRNTEAARHWSALIAEDDSRAAWWVGLAIALETGGEINSAVRAYSEAVQLPGLSPSLADYVRERLKSLQAG
ncbi:MAG TPA: MSHA biogenesis protein MshN [Marinobacter adhaerens]|jgi:MSHA biogenesis protein MshN|uniref:MSHA biogenesis protein MshN n=1 Tax=Marinobacter adhaerens TaxID=1033846 RepID=A0A352IRG2_9GAMM|nr:MSHA biogenesis protein MshN [Marinobacter adhaerens]|tara:strand:+ start:819 stop:2006 length:1188 start_codon:yes stop_codon:yes gene_type:complete